MFRALSALAVFPFLAVGCAPPPTVTSGTFTGSHMLTLQRGSADIVVKASGPASYKITQYAMDHPMGQRPDTEAVFTTPAGTFAVTNKGLSLEVAINGKMYPTSVPGGVGRVTITVDEKGAIAVSPSEALHPPADPPEKANKE